MKVARKVLFKTNEICVGDQITVRLSGFGKFTATAQRVTDKGILFLFDDVIARHPMNETNTNEGGFDKSDMCRWLHETVLPAFPEKLRTRIREITLPTYGEIFGHDDFYENFEPDNDEQFELMKRRGNRVCDFEDDWCWWCGQEERFFGSFRRCGQQWRYGLQRRFGLCRGSSGVLVG